jgi:hypothetical protein
MNVFLSWSGRRSQAVAKVLKIFLPSIINKIQPFLSSQDIEAGARWSSDIAKNLESSNVGIVCLTAENRTEPWVLFEAGAISKLTTLGRAIVLRIGLTPADIQAPLSQFQSVDLDKDGIWSILLTINSAGDHPLRLETLELAFSNAWGAMEANLNKIADELPDEEVVPRRTTEDMLEELVELGRRQDTTIRSFLNFASSAPLPTFPPNALVYNPFTPQTLNGSDNPFTPQALNAPDNLQLLNTLYPAREAPTLGMKLTPPEGFPPPLIPRIPVPPPPTVPFPSTDDDDE